MAEEVKYPPTREFLNIQRRAKALIDRDLERDKLLSGVDKMIRCDWSIPSELETKQWMKEVVETAPRDASETAAKALSSTEPVLSMMPMSHGADDKATADKIEKILGWEFKQMSKKPKRLVTDITRSAVRYDIICGRLLYLPYQLDESSLSDKDKKRKKQRLNRGKFALKMYHPKSVHARTSIYGLEEILLAYNTTARDVIDMYGSEVTKELALELDKYTNGEDVDVNFYQYTTIDERWAWYTIGTDTKNVFATQKQKLVEEENKLPFIDWIYQEGGTDLDSEHEYRINPLLASIYRAGQWELINTISTIYTSEAVSYAAAPRWLVEGPDGKTFEIDYGDPAKIAYIMKGYTVTALQPPTIDKALTEIYDRTKAKIDAGTQVQNLGNPNFAPGVAFASINAILQTTLSGLTPKRKLAESAMVEIFEQMLLWVDFMDDPLEGWGSGKVAGEQLVITKEDFSTSAIYLSVELNATAPTEKQQRINNAVMLIQAGIDRNFVFKQLGIEDYEEREIERIREELLANEVQIAMSRRQFEEELRQQKELAEAQQQAQPAPEPPPPPGGGGGVQSLPEQVSGQGYNPAGGGQPAQIPVPGETRENLTGQDVSGNEIA